MSSANPTPNKPPQKKPIVLIQLIPSYGRDRIYPKNDTAKTLVKLTGKATFNESDLRLIQDLGFEIEWIPRSVSFD